MVIERFQFGVGKFQSVVVLQTDLHQGDQAVVDDAHKLIHDRVVDLLGPFFLNRTDALRLDKNLVCDRGKSEYSPRRAVVEGFLLKEFFTMGDNLTIFARCLRFQCFNRFDGF